jgi:hypothetical protein
MFNLRIYIPNEQGIIEKLYKRQFNLKKGLFRYIYNIKEKKEKNGEEEEEEKIKEFEMIEEDDEDEEKEDDDDNKEEK